jgi:hypothetical protein
MGAIKESLKMPNSKKLTIIAIIMGDDINSLTSEKAAAKKRWTALTFLLVQMRR